MRKILTIARREYQAMVATKAFVIGMAMMPILMLGGIWLPGLLQGFQKSEERLIAVVDGTGQLFDLLNEAAKLRNVTVTTSDERAADSNDESADPAETMEENSRSRRRSMGLDDINTYLLESVSASEFTDQSRLKLSDRIREGSLYAFIEIPADALTAAPIDIANPATLKLPAIAYCAQDAALSDAKRWIETTLNQLIRMRRMSDAGVSPAVLLELERRAPVSSSGLFTMNEAGQIVSEEKPDELTSLFLPMGIMMMMFMIVMMSAQPMLESVLEEKSQRISEVLLGSANARQLMSGKLLGNVAGSLTVFTLYACGAYTAAQWQGYGDRIPFHVLPWFLVYQVLAVLLFSSIFMAIGASVSQLREAQSLLLPVWAVMLLPMMVWFNIVREPNSMLATVLSMFPPSTPLMMTLRLSTGAIIPPWQIVLSIVLLLAGTYVGVTAASRIYRVGILWQGRSPKLSELLRWLVKNPIS